MSTQEPVSGGIELWKAPTSLIKEKSIVIVIALVMMILAVEAIRVAIVAWGSGVTPMAFGLMPTRELGVGDAMGVIAIAALGIMFVGWHLVRVVLRGMPWRLQVVEQVGGGADEPAAVDETACLVAEFDGVLKPTFYYFFTDISEIDTITRGTMGGGGHQVRVRLKGRRLAVAVARLETSVEAERLVSRLQADRVRILNLDADIRRD